MAYPNNQHRIHSDNEPLPRSGEGPTVDYSADNMNRVADQNAYPPAQRDTTTHYNTHHPSHIPDRASIGTDDARSLEGVQFPPEIHRGGQSPGNQPGLTSDESPFNDVPQAKPGISDKIVGKTEKVKFYAPNFANLRVLFP